MLMAKKDDNRIGKIVLTYNKDENGDVTTKLDLKGFNEYIKEINSDDYDTKMDGVASMAIAYELGIVAMFRTLNIKGKNLQQFLQDVVLPKISEDVEDIKG